MAQICIILRYLYALRLFICTVPDSSMLVPAILRDASVFVIIKFEKKIKYVILILYRNLWGEKPLCLRI